MIPTIRLACLSFTALIACAALSRDGKRAVRMLRASQASTIVGGASICVKSIANSTESCYLRVVTVGGTDYRCDGNDLDQVCLSATTQTNNVCGESKATCGGNQFKFVDEKWEPENKPCQLSQYETRFKESGTCTPAPPPP